MEVKRKKKIQHWRPIEDLHYNFFLIYNYKKLATRKKESKLYIQMAKFIPNKTSAQCRTHHQKKIKELKQRSEKIEFQNLRNFYHINYINRRLPPSHLKQQIRECLKSKKKSGILAKKEYEDYETNVNEFLSDLPEQDRIYRNWENSQSPFIQPQSNQENYTSEKIQQKGIYFEQSSLGYAHHHDLQQSIFGSFGGQQY